MKKTTLAAFGLAFSLAAGTALAADAPAPQGGPAHHPRMFEETDTNHDGSITKDEWVAKGDKMFKDIDTNNDGKISQDEMRAHHEKMREKFKEMRGDHGDDKPAAAPASPAKH